MRDYLRYPPMAAAKHSKRTHPCNMAAAAATKQNKKRHDLASHGGCGGVFDTEIKAQQWQQQSCPNRQRVHLMRLVAVAGYSNPGNRHAAFDGCGGDTRKVRLVQGQPQGTKPERERETHARTVRWCCGENTRKAHLKWRQRQSNKTHSRKDTLTVRKQAAADVLFDVPTAVCLFVIGRFAT